MTDDEYGYHSKVIRTISIEEIVSQPALAFGHDVWLGIFEACLQLFFPLGLDYGTLRVGIGLDGTLCFGDEGIAYSAASSGSDSSDCTSAVEAGNEQRRPESGFALTALIRSCSWMRCCVNRNGQPYVVASKGTDQVPSTFRWESTVRNVLCVSPGGHGRTATWLVGRLRSFAVAQPGLHIEIWDARLGMVSSFTFPKGVASIVEEENAHLLKVSEVLHFDAFGGGFTCKIALQLFQFGRPAHLIFVNGVRMNRAGSEHDGLWQGIASALGVADASDVRRYVEQRWSIGTAICIRSSGAVQFGASWGDYVNDERIRNSVADCISRLFRQEYERQAQLPNFGGDTLADLARRVLAFVE